MRTGDWITFFDSALAAEPWRDVLALWWPRLLPGIAAGATHGVIRVGHAVRSLLEVETVPRVTELGRGLAYWAARWQPLAAAGAGTYPASDPRSALDAVPRVPSQQLGIRNRLAQLADLDRWPSAAAAIPGAGDETVRLRGIVTAAVLRHQHYGYGNPVMLVHAATAPAAVLRALPALPPTLHAPSLAAAWAAAAAITAAYSPAAPSPVQPASGAPSPEAPAPELVRAPAPHSAAGDAASVMDRAAAGGDPHAIKFADAAIEMHTLVGDATLLTAADNATALIAADT